MKPTNWMCLIVLFSLVSGCGQPKQITSKPPATVTTGPAITKEEAEQYASQLQKAVAEGNALEITRHLRALEILKHAFSDINMPAGMIRGLEAGANKLTSNLADSVKNGGTFELLRINEKGDSYEALFRLINSEQGLNYQAITLKRYPDGVGAADIYIYMLGEPMTVMFRRLFMPLIAKANKGFLEQLNPLDKLWLDHAKTFSEISQAAQTNTNYQAAIAKYHSLPEELRNQKIIQLAVIMLTSRNDEEEYLNQLERYMKNFPNDPSIDLVSMDAYFLKKKYDKCLVVLDRLNSSVGGDPYLLFLKATIHLESGDAKSASELASKLIQDSPDKNEGYLVAIRISLKKKTHAETLKLLRDLKRNCNYGMTAEDLQANPEYSEFVKSEEFKKFQELDKEDEKRDKQIEK